jgi:hypothetical protein
MPQDYAFSANSMPHFSQKPTPTLLRLIYPHKEELFVFITYNKILILSVADSSPFVGMKSFTPTTPTTTTTTTNRKVLRGRKWKTDERCVTSERDLLIHDVFLH